MAPGGTISRSVFDSLGRLESQWVGTDDVPTSGDWSPTNNSGANMTKVVEYEYDLDSSGGNGNRTKEIRYLSDAVEANAQVTRYRYDWRDRQVFVIDPQEYDSKVTYSRVDLDHMGRATKSERYYDADDDESFPSDGTVDGGDRLLSRSESLYDKLGRVYQSKTYAVNPSTGSVGDALVSNSWYDALGRTLKQQSGSSQAFSKMVYDAPGPRDQAVSSLRHRRNLLRRRGRCDGRHGPGAERGELRCQRQRDPDHALRPQAYRRRYRRTLHLLGPRHLHRQLVRRGQPADGHGRLRHQRRQRFLTARGRPRPAAIRCWSPRASTTRPAWPTR